MIIKNFNQVYEVKNRVKETKNLIELNDKLLVYL